MESKKIEVRANDTAYPEFVIEEEKEKVLSEKDMKDLLDQEAQGDGKIDFSGAIPEIHLKN